MENINQSSTHQVRRTTDNEVVWRGNETFADITAAMLMKRTGINNVAEPADPQHQPSVEE
jgi:hypothetical protein